MISRLVKESAADRDTFPPVRIWLRGAPRSTRPLPRSAAIVGARA